MTFRRPMPKGASGYRPVTGNPRDADGHLILDWIFPVKGREAAQPAAIEPEPIKQSARQSLLL